MPSGTSKSAVFGRFRVGVDVGGTFTDAILFDAEEGSIRRAKVLTTPDDQSVGTLQAIEALGIQPSSIDYFCHGFTAGINALLTRTGVGTGLLCTEGMRELLDMGQLRRPQGDGLYDATWIRPHQQRPLVPRRYVREVRERLRADGTVHVPLDEEGVRSEVAFLRDEGITSIAVCLLHAYRNSEHEDRIAEIIAEEYPEAYVQTSSARMVVGEYTRTSAAVIDAYVGPIIVEYLKTLKGRLSDAGFDHEPQIMQMNAGVRTLTQTVDQLPLNAVESGPVAGMMGSKVYSEREGIKNVVCVDVGGTSTDIGFIADGRLKMTGDWEFEFGIPLGVPAVDVRSIGAGGGSIIHVDDAGTLLVGPESAGSSPGPACYGLGGTRPTITDAYVALGIIQPDLFLNGEMELDAEASMRALATVGDTLEMGPLEVAHGAVRLMTANIANEIMKMVLESGLDIRDFVLMPYGGAGSLGAWDVARELGIGEVLVPLFPGGFAALGMVVSPVKVQTARSIVEQIDQLPTDLLNSHVDEMVDQVSSELGDQGVTAESVTAAMSGMYVGQRPSFDDEVQLELPITASSLERWASQFHVLHNKLYGYDAPETPVVAISLSVEARGPEVSVPLPQIEPGGAEPAEESITRRELHVSAARVVDAPFYKRDLLKPGNQIAGPAVIDDGLATIYIPSGSTASIDKSGNARIRASAEDPGQTDATLMDKLRL